MVRKAVINTDQGRDEYIRRIFLLVAAVGVVAGCSGSIRPSSGGYSAGQQLETVPTYKNLRMVAILNTKPGSQQSNGRSEEVLQNDSKVTQGIIAILGQHFHFLGLMNEKDVPKVNDADLFAYISTMLYIDAQAFPSPKAKVSIEIDIRNREQNFVEVFSGLVGEGKGIDKSMARDRAIINASGKLDRFMKSSRNLAELNEKTLLSNRSVLVGNTVKKDGLNVAIADMVPQGVSMSDAAVVSDWLRGALVANSRYNVVERNEMEKVLAEQAFQQTGCTSQECAVKLGKILNVKRMVVGSFGKFLDAYVLNVRVIDVETGSVIHSDSTKGKTTDEIEVNIKSLASRLSL